MLYRSGKPRGCRKRRKYTEHKLRSIHTAKRKSQWSHFYTKTIFRLGECSADTQWCRWLMCESQQPDSSCIKDRKVEATDRLLKNKAPTGAKNKWGSWRKWGHSKWHWCLCGEIHILRILCCLCLMTTWSRFQYPSSYTVPVSRLVINAECCLLTIDLIHCGVCFLFCEVFNYTFPLLIVHVLVFELYLATPQRCPDQFCLLRLQCILTWKLASASVLFQEILVCLKILRSLVPTFLLRCFKCWMNIAFIIAHERNIVVVLFGTPKVQSIMLTEVRDCDLLIFVTSSTFLKRKDMLKEKSS